MGLGSSSPEDMNQLEETKQLVKELIDCDEVVIFSKTTCPYCRSAKGVFDTMQCKYTAVELDDRPDGYTIQNILEQMTGARTPREIVDIKEQRNCVKLCCHLEKSRLPNKSAQTHRTFFRNGVYSICDVPPFPASLSAESVWEVALISRSFIIQGSLQKYSKQSKCAWFWTVCIMAALGRQIFIHIT
ncbi:hypothetical protein Cfor_02590 [Coptotermes formosanus]|uniref:Glutaredoxin domain-containing protein n=1 Tax=Coptotermes formosanus TaxID=36987 RepID=A0A6L2Q2L1_COPFO|nr:hypothetical protein Cfor_02590 [Coptotermes formosanus]